MRRESSLFEQAAAPQRATFQLHTLFADVRRGGGKGRSRFATDPAGGSVDAWKTLDAFSIASGGEEGGLILVYYSPDRLLNAARDFLRVRGHTNFLGDGTVNSLFSRPEWRFHNPRKSATCIEIMHDVASVPEFLQYYSDFLVIGPDGSQLGKVRDFADSE